MYSGSKSFGFRVFNLELLREKLAGLWQNLHQADGIGVRNDVGLERGFLANQTGGEHRIEIVALGFAAKRRFVGQRVDRLPYTWWELGNFSRVEIGDDQAAVGHAGGEVTLIEGALRGFEEQARRACGEEAGFQFEFGRSVERDDAERLRTDPAIFRGVWNRLVDRVEHGCGWNRGEKVRGVRFARGEFFEASGCGVAEIGLRDAIDVGREIRARVAGISATFGVAAQPVERVGRVG